MRTTLRRRSRSSSGFTLLELLVVVILIAVIAMIAVPTMVTARNDRLAFSYARRITQIYHKAHTDAVGTGAANVVAFTTQFGTEGFVGRFEARNNTCFPGAPPPCPSNPSPSCTQVGTFVSTWTIATPDNPAQGRLVEALNIVTSGPNEIGRSEGIAMTGFRNGVASPAIVMCFTPTGETYVGSGGNLAGAVANMSPFGLPFGEEPTTDPTPTDPTRSGLARIEVIVTRATAGPSGQRRRVIIAGGASPRLGFCPPAPAPCPPP
jgi:prepilin-type N-terminal cleavage/methylation domain-containing protein